MYNNQRYIVNAIKLPLYELYWARERFCAIDLYHNLSRMDNLQTLQEIRIIYINFLYK